MIQFLRQWVALLDQTERDLRAQGYITVYGGCTSFVVRTGIRNEESALKQTTFVRLGSNPKP
jgi:hypothetical protein